MELERLPKLLGILAMNQGGLSQIEICLDVCLLGMGIVHLVCVVGGATLRRYA